MFVYEYFIKLLFVFNFAFFCVFPGFIDTEMTEMMEDNRRKEITKLIPAGRIGNANEVANVVHFLACDSTFITGHVLPVDGGLALTM